VRCSRCNSVFPLWASVKALVKKAEAKQPLWERWRRPLTIAVSVAAPVLVLLVVAGSVRSRNAGRVRVNQAEGQVSLDGKPIPNATVFLHPIGPANPRVPRPRAVVREDGTFALGTYRTDDGAPAGDYKVTVQWFAAAAGGSPRNQLPPRYASADTSGLTLHVKEGENHLPRLELSTR
jgi:hypothetical protein